MTKKEIGFFDLSLPLFVVISISFIFTIVLLFATFEFREQIDELNNSIPHKVCWNETINIINYTMANDCFNYIQKESNKIIKNGSYEYYAIQFICAVSNSKLEQKEICEFKDNEGNIYEVKRK